MDVQKKVNSPASDNDWMTDDDNARSAPPKCSKAQDDHTESDQFKKSLDEPVKPNEKRLSDDWSDDDDEPNKFGQSSETKVDDCADQVEQPSQRRRAVESQMEDYVKSGEPNENLPATSDFNDFKVPDLPNRANKDADAQSNSSSNADKSRPKKTFYRDNNMNYRGGHRGGGRGRGRGGSAHHYRNYYNHHNSFSSNASDNNPNNYSRNENGNKQNRRIDRRYNRSLNSDLRDQDAHPLNGETVTKLDDPSNLSDEEKREKIEDLNEELEQKSNRKQVIERNLHNQKTYYDQRNNVESDEMSDIQSDFDSQNKTVSLDEKMKELVKLFIESFVPFNILHSSYFSNILRSRFGIRKMPKLVQMKDFFLVMSELGHRYIAQTLSGATSYTLCFEFWKTTNRRHQFLTVRASYIDVYVRRTPVLTCFKVFPDWTSDDYIGKFNTFFKHYRLERVKVFSVVTNFRAKQFLSAIDKYIGSEKILFCLAHQLNNKFNEILLSCDYEEDKIHYEKKYKELTSIPKSQKMEDDEQCGSEQEYYSDENQNSNDESKDNCDEEMNDDKPKEDEAGNDSEAEVALNDLNTLNQNEDEEDDEDLAYFENENLAFVRLVEEPIDVFGELDMQKSDEVPYNVKVVKSLLRTYAFIAHNEELLDELNGLTSKKDGHDFELYHLLAYKNWNYIFQFIFYVKKTKDDLRAFVKEHTEIPFDLKDEDFEFIDDLFDLLAFITKKMGMLSLEEQIGLGKSLNIMKSFVDTFAEIEVKTEHGKNLKEELLNFFKTKQGIYERDNFYSVASLLDPKCSNYDFQSDETFDSAVKNLHEVLCYRLDEQFNLALYKIRAPLRIELENFHKYRPYKTTNEITKFQLNSPVLQNLAYDYLTGSAICFEPKQIDYQIREKIIESLSQIRRDTLSKILLLNSLDAEVFDKLIEYAKFW